MTMNLGMTALQDELAKQAEKPTTAQQEQIRAHRPRAPSCWLTWASPTVSGSTSWPTTMMAKPCQIRSPAQPAGASHHDPATGGPLCCHDQSTGVALGKSTSDSARALLSGGSPSADALAKSLVQIVGLYPPGTYTHGQRRTGRGAQAQLPAQQPRGANRPTDERPLAASAQHSGQPTRIHTALAASAVRARVNHFHILGWARSRRRARPTERSGWATPGSGFLLPRFGFRALEQAPNVLGVAPDQADITTMHSTT